MSDRNDRSGRGPGLFERAAKAHHAGRLEEAERLYRKALAQHPDDPRLLLYAAIHARQRGQRPRALHLIDRAVAQAPGYAQAHLHRGSLLYEGGQVEEALAAWRRAQMVDPAMPEAAIALYAAYERHGQPAAALAALDHLLLGPADSTPANQSVTGGTPAARPAPAPAPARPAPALARPAPALARPAPALARPAPGAPGAADSTGSSRGKAGDPATHHRHNGRMWNLRGNLLHQLGRLEEAAWSYERAVHLTPDLAEALVNLGTVRRELRRPRAALAAFDQALTIAPKLAAAHNNRANTLKELGRLGEACAAFDQALALTPDFAEGAVNRGKCRLAQGDLTGGFADLERRFEATALTETLTGPRAAARSPLPWPPWQGEPLAGRRLLIRREQGLGDELMFATLYPDAIARAGVGACTIECDPRLVTLFRRSFPDAVIGAEGPVETEAGNGRVPESEAGSGRALKAEAEGGRGQESGAAPAFDFQVSAGSLARVLRPRLADWPAAGGPLLTPDPARVAAWRARLAALGPGLRLGLCWQSRNRAGDRAFAYTRLEAWAPLLTLPGLRLVNLQYDDCEAELRATEARLGVTIARWPDTDLADDLESAAALTTGLDLVISAPTAAGELAAAVGTPVWRSDRAGSWTLLGTACRPWFAGQRPVIAAPGAALEAGLAEMARTLRAAAAHTRPDKSYQRA